MNMHELVYIDNFGLLGSNFYWHKHDAKGITKEEILSVGLTSDRVEVHRNIIDALVVIDQRLQDERGWRLYIKEGYRSKALYKLVYDKRVGKFGKEETDGLFNMHDMPHASGYSVDAALWDPEKNSEVYMRDAADGTPALYVDFYKDRSDEVGTRFYELQRYTIALMEEHGFTLGTKREYFHFDYRR